MINYEVDSCKGIPHYLIKKNMDSNATFLILIRLYIKKVIIPKDIKQKINYRIKIFLFVKREFNRPYTWTKSSIFDFNLVLNLNR